MDAVRSLSLLDLAGRSPVCWYVIFKNRENPRFWNRWLEPGYQHVELWRPVQYGPAADECFWLVVDPCLEHVDTKINWDPTAPWIRDPAATAMRVDVAVRSRRVREWFFVGPITCVEIAKAHLGINSAWIRTPWQLAKHLRAHRYALVLR